MKFLDFVVGVITPKDNGIAIKRNENNVFEGILPPKDLFANSSKCSNAIRPSMDPTAKPLLHLIVRKLAVDVAISIYSYSLPISKDGNRTCLIL